MNRLFPLALIASLAAVGCGDPLSPSDLIGSNWQLTSLQDGTAIPVTVADPLACTRVFCGGASLDPAYPAALHKARAASLDGQAQLSIHGDGVTLRFKK